MLKTGGGCVLPEGSQKTKNPVEFHNAGSRLGLKEGLYYFNLILFSNLPPCWGQRVL